MTTTAQADAESAVEGNHRVSFSTVEVKEYPIIPGVNPAVSMGVPLTIDWAPLREQADSYDIDDYEQTNPSRERRGPLELRRLPSRRSELLLMMGVSRSEILEATKMANKNTFLIVISSDRKIDAALTLSVEARFL